MATQPQRVVILDRKEALRRAGNLSKSTELRLARCDPSFPKPVRLSPRRVGYFEHEWSACDVVFTIAAPGRRCGTAAWHR